MKNKLGISWYSFDHSLTWISISNSYRWIFSSFEHEKIKATMYVLLCEKIKNKNRLNLVKCIPDQEIYFL